MLLHLRLVLHLALIFITFAVGITFAVVITFSGDTIVKEISSWLNNTRASFLRSVSAIVLLKIVSGACFMARLSNLLARLTAGIFESKNILKESCH